MLSRWREAFLRGGVVALEKHPRDDRGEQIKGLEAKLGHTAMNNELSLEKIGWMENCYIESFLHTRPHSPLGYRSPVSEAILPLPTLATLTLKKWYNY